MGLRFRKSIKIAPGIKMNVGKRGATSISLGNMNIGSKGIYQNFNIPGTGISFRSKVIGKQSPINSPKKHYHYTTNIPLIFSLDESGNINF